VTKTEAEGRYSGRSLNPPVTKNHIPPSIEQTNQESNHAGSLLATMAVPASVLPPNNLMGVLIQATMYRLL